MNIGAIFMIATEHLIWRNKSLLNTDCSFHIKSNFIFLCCTKLYWWSYSFQRNGWFVKLLFTLWGVATLSGNVLGSWRIWEASASMKIFSFWDVEHLALTHWHFIAVRDSRWWKSQWELEKNSLTYCSWLQRITVQM